MRTIIKTGAILRIEGPHERNVIGDMIYGDLHAIGDCGLIYFPVSQGLANQKIKRAIHGSVHLSEDMYFYRRMHNDPSWGMGVLIAPVSCFRVSRSVLHDVDATAWEMAGGVLLDSKDTIQ